MLNRRYHNQRLGLVSPSIPPIAVSRTSIYLVLLRPFNLSLFPYLLPAQLRAPLITRITRWSCGNIRAAPAAAPIISPARRSVTSLAGVNNGSELEATSSEDGASDEPKKTGLSMDQRRIYIMGTGAVGKFVAHSLARMPSKPPITIISRKIQLVNGWRKKNGIEVITDGVSDFRRGIDLEIVQPPEMVRLVEEKDNDARVEKPPEDHNQPLIHQLVVATKAQSVANAVEGVKDRLGRESTILLLQNGMGLVEELNTKVFPNAETRPNYMLGVNSHGLQSETPFRVKHNGVGTIALGVCPRDDTIPSSAWAPSSRYLLRTLTRSPALAAVGFPPTDLLQIQLEKLAVNCVVNPLTALMDCYNGELLYNFAITRVMRLLISEISLVIRSLPELKGLPNLDLRFGPDRLEDAVVSVAGKTSLNSSSMREDILKGQRTEIEYINGYIVKRGEDIGIKCVLNYMLLQMLKGKQQQMHRKTADVTDMDSFRRARSA